MLKYLGFMVLGLWMVSAEAGWTDENCTNRGGDIITEPTNNVKFCRSKKGMNWASAHSWCQKHGGHMASVANLCPGTPLSAQEACDGYGADAWFKETCVNTTTGIMYPWHLGYSTKLYCGDQPIAGSWTARAYCEWGSE